MSRAEDAGIIILVIIAVFSLFIEISKLQGENWEKLIFGTIIGCILGFVGVLIYINLFFVKKTDLAENKAPRKD